MCRLIVFFVLFVAVCNAQVTQVNEVLNNSLHTGLSEKIGNFSVELLYFTTQLQEKSSNFVISPVTVWTILAVIAEGASDMTLRQICEPLRIQPSLKNVIRRDYQEIAKWLQVKTTTVELQKFNALFMDEKHGPLKDFTDSAKEYDTRLITANFSDSALTTNSINNLISSVTHGHIRELVSYNDIMNSNFILTSALYFKGQWTIPFDSSLTTKQPFYGSDGKKIGDVNMMYARNTYPFANIRSLQARVLEIPYGKDNRLSMLIMLPDPGVSINNMFYNFGKVSLDIVFNELKVSVQEYSDDEVDCFIPRFKIESNIELTNTLKSMGIVDLFDMHKARLPLISNRPVYVSRIIHKAEIEVTEEGTVAAAASAAEFSNRMGILRFEANRPFCYLIVEKTTNTIAFGGFYQSPSLF